MSEKIYCDVEGGEWTLDQMVRIEPEWAASRIRAGEEAIAERDALRAALEMIAGRRQCIDNLMSHKEIALAALELKP